MPSSAGWRVCLVTTSLVSACAAHANNNNNNNNNNANDFVTVAPAACQPVAQGVALPADLEAFRAAVRVCSLTRASDPAPVTASASATATATGAASAKVRLLSVFTDDYYKGLPADAPWQNFPLPMLVDDTGRCLGRIGHLFPVDPPQELIVSAGRWQRGIPQELRLKVKSPAVGGDSTLPSLHRNPRTGGYAAKNTNPSQDETPCPPK